MNEEFYYNLRQSIEGRCAWNSAGNCCRGIEEAYKAGASAMREKCAEEAEEYRDAGCITSVSGNNIAAAIRKLEVE